MSRHTLCTTFIDLAEWTRRALRDGYRAGLFIGEESLTDFALVRIANQNPRQVRTRKFTRAQEGRRTGADWLWLFGNENESWMPVLVQAKVMHPGSSPRMMLSYRNGLQNRLLLQFALEYGLFPVYCIYNPVTRKARQDTPPLSCGLGSEQYACALLTLEARQQLLLSGRVLQQSQVLSNSVALASLVCCTFDQTEGLADGVAGMLEIAAGSLEGARRNSELEQALMRLNPREMIIPGPRAEEFIARVEEASTHSATGDPLLAGVVLFSSGPLTGAR